MRKIDVRIGEVRSGHSDVILETNAIGSCIAVVACDAAKKNGAMAHIMLPGKASAKRQNIEKTRYAVDAVDAMITQMAQLGSKRSDIKIIMVGGGNVLQKEGDTICRENIESILSVLEEANLEIVAQAVGGVKRRSVSFDIANSAVFYTEGDSGRKLLWKADETVET